MAQKELAVDRMRMVADLLQKNQVSHAKARQIPVTPMPRFSLSGTVLYSQITQRLHKPDDRRVSCRPGHGGTPPDLSAPQQFLHLQPLSAFRRPSWE